MGFLTWTAYLVLTFSKQIHNLTTHFSSLLQANVEVWLKAEKERELRFTIKPRAKPKKQYEIGHNGSKKDGGLWLKKPSPHIVDSSFI